jgi:hypothetical protein
MRQTKEESMSKKERKDDGAILLTIDQANVALACAQNDITASEFGEMPDYGDVSQMMFYLQRAELVQRLRTALKAHGEGV